MLLLPRKDMVTATEPQAEEGKEERRRRRGQSAAYHSRQNFMVLMAAADRLDPWLRASGRALLDCCRVDSCSGLAASDLVLGGDGVS